MPAIDTRQRPEVEIDAQKCAGHEFGGGEEARRVVVFHQIIVDGLRRVDEVMRPSPAASFRICWVPDVSFPPMLMKASAPTASSPDRIRSQ